MMLASLGLRVRKSTLMPIRVLMQEIMSAPASSTLWAISAMLVTLGESLMMTGLFGAFSRTAFVTLAAWTGSAPKMEPPSFTLGQEMLTSRAATPSMALSSAASSPNSSADVAYMFTIMGTSFQGSCNSL